MFLHVMWSQMQEIGHFEQFHVDGFVGNDVVILDSASDDAHTNRKRRRGMPERGAGRPHVRPILIFFAIGDKHLDDYFQENVRFTVELT